MFNPYGQNRLDNLIQQKNMIEQQIQSLQQMQMPPININNNMTPPQNNYDGNFKWVENEDQAKQVANNNLPLILFDRNKPIFYMKNIDGSFKTFKFEEIIEQPQISSDARIDALENKLNTILNALQQPNTNTPNQDKQSPQRAKTNKKGDMTSE